MDDTLVWYASYGSNLLEARLLAYLRGEAAPGRTSAERGSRNSAGPQQFQWLAAPYQLYFAGSSNKWDGGGVAFITPMPEIDAVCHLRLALIELGQFEDILAQENRRETTPLDLERVVSHGRVHSGDGAYDLVLGLGHVDDYPVVTFTSPEVRTPTNPAASYRAVIEAGLATHPDLTDDDISTYLNTAVTNAWGQTPGVR